MGMFHIHGWNPDDIHIYIYTIWSLSAIAWCTGFSTQGLCMWFERVLGAISCMAAALPDAIWKGIQKAHVQQVPGAKAVANPNRKKAPPVDEVGAVGDLEWKNQYIRQSQIETISSGPLPFFSSQRVSFIHMAAALPDAIWKGIQRLMYNRCLGQRLWPIQIGKKLHPSSRPFCHEESSFNGIGARTTNVQELHF